MSSGLNRCLAIFCPLSVAIILQKHWHRFRGLGHPLACFTGKVAAIMSASPGILGGLRGLVQVRSILSNIQVLVLPEQMAIPKANEAFNADGTLKDVKQQAAIEALGCRLTEILIKLK